MQNEAALRWLNEFSTQGILVTDADLIVRGWNHWLESHTGRSAAEMIGRNLLDLYPTLAARGLDQYYGDALAGQVRVLSYRFHRYLLPIKPQGEGAAFTQMQQSARIAPLIESDQVIGTITVIDDVTERVAHEQQLETLLAREQSAREEAEAANRAKDEFLATVSHELRTPLNAIFGWIQIMRRAGLDEEFLARGLETVERNVKIQAKLIEDILDVSRIITGKLSLDVRPVDLVGVIQAAIDSARPAADAKEIVLDASLERNAGPVSGDPSRLQQIVWNLVSNAIKFTPKSGRISVRLKRGSAHSEIEVSDSGQGISAEFLPYVFDRFRQADSSTTRRHGGLGLGLSIVRHLVEMHGGTVHAASDGEGRGATFTVSLPLIAVREPEPAVVASSVKAESSPPALMVERASGANGMGKLSGVRVLVVDDEEDARESLKLLLAAHGAEVKLSASVKEAIEMLSIWKPDVLVSDIGMPDEDGYALIKRVRALEAERGISIPALALTGYARPEDRSRLLAAGYRLHLAKPVEMSELIGAIRNLAGQRSKKSRTTAE